jgi:pyruvate dehydrogenase E2 component (dihydrolipoamide acetyltransferase)
VRISPLARKLADEKGIDPRGVTGSGPGGRIVRADIEAAVKAGPAKPTKPAKEGGGGASAWAMQLGPASGPIQEEKVVAVSNMRATIARRLLESKTQIPHFYLDISVDAEPLLTLRVQLNSSLEKAGVKLSVNDFILKASAEALRRVPAANCSWEPGVGAAAPAVRYHGSAHVSFAVAIEDGLITPVIRDTHLKTVFAISAEAKALARLAKDKKLQPAQYTGGTFCVSNLGMMGVDRFCAIINPPNAAILAVGATTKQPVVKDGQIVIGQRMNLTLSCDHRVVDGAVGATFLAALKDLLEKPALLLL